MNARYQLSILSPALVAFGLFSSVPAQTPMVLTQSTTLQADVVHAGPGPAIVVAAPGITIDLNGFTVSGDGTVDSFGVDNTAGHPGVTVRNGTIADFDAGVFGIFAHGLRCEDLSVPAAGWVYTGPTAATGSVGIALLGCNDVALERVDVSNGVFGIVGDGCQGLRADRLTGTDCFFGVYFGEYGFPGATSGSLTRSLFADNDFGVLLEHVQGFAVERCSASGGVTGIRVGNGAVGDVGDVRIACCATYFSQWGSQVLRLGQSGPIPVLGMVIEQNVSAFNGAGMSLVQVEGATVADNRCWANEAFGIALFAESSGNQVNGNTALLNGLFGIGLLPNLGLPPVPGPTGNTVAANTALGNGAFDLFHAEFTVGNLWLDNRYRTSEGAEIQ